MLLRHRHCLKTRFYGRWIEVLAPRHKWVPRSLNNWSVAGENCLIKRALSLKLEDKGAAVAAHSISGRLAVTQGAWEPSLRNTFVFYT